MLSRQTKSGSNVDVATEARAGVAIMVRVRAKKRQGKIIGFAENVSSENSIFSVASVSPPINSRNKQLRQSVLSKC